MRQAFNRLLQSGQAVCQPVLRRAHPCDRFLCILLHTPGQAASVEHLQQGQSARLKSLKGASAVALAARDPLPTLHTQVT